MNDNLDSELDSVSKRVFEQLCFMCPSPEPGEDEPDFPIEAVASISCFCTVGATSERVRNDSSLGC